MPRNSTSARSREVKTSSAMAVSFPTGTSQQTKSFTRRSPVADHVVLVSPTSTALANRSSAPSWRFSGSANSRIIAILSVSGSPRGIREGRAPGRKPLRSEACVLQAGCRDRILTPLARWRRSYLRMVGLLPPVTWALETRYEGTASLRAGPAGDGDDGPRRW
jgi:hypothetical protein